MTSAAHHEPEDDLLAEQEAIKQRYLDTAPKAFLQCRRNGHAWIDRYDNAWYRESPDDPWVIPQYCQRCERESIIVDQGYGYGGDRFVRKYPGRDDGYMLTGVGTPLRPWEVKLDQLRKAQEAEQRRRDRNAAARRRRNGKRKTR